ncbi:MAG TPA: hypothetical protein VHF89_02685 [Solirubrobacteraceae bacterium]|nr:hypothetical protein [Solirubrobacteraceae bacterium]
MDYAFFETLSPADARAYLDRYLELEPSEIEPTLREARADGVVADYTLDSVAPFLEWLGPRIRARPADVDVPDWVRASMEEHGGIRELDEESLPLVLRASYYLGQSFVRDAGLEWGLGRAGRAEFQQPVVTGFRDDADLPPLVVAENLLIGADQPGFGDRVRTMVATWRHAAGPVSDAR